MIRTSSVLVAQVRKPPDIAETDAEADAGEQEVDLPVPRFARVQARCRLRVAAIGQQGRAGFVAAHHRTAVG